MFNDVGTAGAVALAVRPVLLIERLAHGPFGAATLEAVATVTRPDAGWALAAAARLYDAPLHSVIDRLAGLIGEAIAVPRPPLVAVLTGDCSHSPLKVSSGRPAERVTSAELGGLHDALAPGERWIGPMLLAGDERRVLAVRSVPANATGSVFVIGLDAADERDVDVEVIAGLCDLAALTWIDRAVSAPPGYLASTLAAAQERARAIGELGEAHEATLSGILAALRARDVPDGSARSAAIELATTALIGLRESGHRNRDLSEEPLDAAFERLRDQLAPVIRFATATLELAGPGTDRPSIPAGIAHAARAVSRSLVMAAADQASVSRMRLGWRPDGGFLVIAVRDDGPGQLDEDTLRSSPIGERLDALSARLTVDAVAGWGSTVTVRVPLAAAPVDADSPLSALNSRELEVLTLVARGERNARIAEALTITSHTVKFHVASILRKLDVATRGEAAAVAHANGLPISRDL